MIEPNTIPGSIQDVTGKLYLRESIASGTVDGRPCEISLPVGGTAVLYELPAHEDKPRMQWLVSLDSEKIFGAMLEAS